MKIRDLFETPLPASWDKEVFGQDAVFSRMLAYAKERAQQIGRGSSRVAFIIKYKGQDTVLKIALNNAGLHQNAEEAKISDDYVISQMGLLIPTIDYEQRTNLPTWIHQRYAKKIKKSDFKRFLAGFDLADVIDFIEEKHGRRSGWRSAYVRLADQSAKQKLYNTKLFQALDEYAGSSGNTLDDLDRTANWGLYRGRPVVIDFGFTEYVKLKFYT